MRRKITTQEEVRSLLYYDAETGLFWSRRTGKVIGARRKGGYLDYNGQLLHRLAWLYVHGRFPVGTDHINGITSDNRISNLREATQKQNLQNQKGPQKGNASGFLGVYLDKRKKKWRAQIRVSGEKVYLGIFNCPTAAYFLGYLPAKRRLHAYGTL